MNDEQKKLFGIDKLNIKRSEIPAVTHIDYSARIQTVNEKTNKPYYDLISKFKERTGCPLLVNTSFNVRGEPIVNSPTDAFNCFMGTELDYLVIGNCILDKSNQDINLKKDYTKEFELDWIFKMQIVNDNRCSWINDLVTRSNIKILDKNDFLKSKIVKNATGVENFKAL